MNGVVEAMARAFAAAVAAGDFDTAESLALIAFTVAGVQEATLQ
jgi:hypothetical protein